MFVLDIGSVSSYVPAARSGGCVRFSKVSAALSVWLASCAIPAAVTANDFCLDDKALHDLVVIAYPPALVIGVQACGEAHSQAMSERGNTLLRSFFTTYEDNLLEANEASIASFERHFPGEGREVLVTVLQIASEQSLEPSALTADNCKQLLDGLDAAVAANDWAAAIAPALETLPLQRSQVPVC